MKRLVTISVFAILCLLFACKTKVLSLKNKPGYSEYNLLSKKTHTELKQIANYRTNALDGNFSYILTFTILDSAALVNKKHLRFPADNNIVHCEFDIVSVWNWEEENYDLRGDFTLLNRTDTSVTVEEDIDVHDFKGKRHFIYRGKRTFTKPDK